MSGALAMLVTASFVLGAVGVIGWRLGVPEPVLFYALASLFLTYHFAMKDAWARLHAFGFAGPPSSVSRET